MAPDARIPMDQANPLPGWSARYFHSDNVTVSQWDIEAEAAELHEHHHPYEETWVVVAGEAVLVVDGEPTRLGPGDAAVVPPGVAHAMRPVGACRAVVVDHPVRRDFPGRSSHDEA